MDVLAYVAAREGVTAIPGDDPSHDRPRRDDDENEDDAIGRTYIKNN